jgi:hypothetical protein
VLITRPSIQNVFKKKCSLSLSPSIFGFRSNITCPRTNLAISFQVNTSHVIAVRQNLLPYLLDLLRFIELYLKHETERHCVGISPERAGGVLYVQRDFRQHRNPDNICSVSQSNVNHYKINLYF